MFRLRGSDSNNLLILVDFSKGSTNCMSQKINWLNNQGSVNLHEVSPSPRKPPTEKVVIHSRRTKKKGDENVGV